MVEKSDIGVHKLMSELQVAPWFGGDLVSFLPTKGRTISCVVGTDNHSLTGRCGTASTRAFGRKVYLRYVQFQNLPSQVYIKSTMAAQSSETCASTSSYSTHTVRCRDAPGPSRRRPTQPIGWGENTYPCQVPSAELGLYKCVNFAHQLRQYLATQLMLHTWIMTEAATEDTRSTADVDRQPSMLPHTAR